ncbi:glycosyltransferase family 4 protein [Chthonobacter rhizosphaerae]|uniref:glycosyltransferase family 4 protein n=1 Tax=Chthonobacter rhizosphaerae TaxID=2735553 RepID=UPI0015EEA3F1|nr:glycosyltransferase family 4 protein [Chthonobacter rhizosphaerae]
MRRRVVIHWGVSSFFGWGVYGLNLALHWSNDPAVEPLCSYPLRDDQIVVDPLKTRVLARFRAESEGLQGRLAGLSNRTVTADGPVLSALGNDFRTAPLRDELRLAGTPTVGVVFFEVPQLDAETVERAKALPFIVAGSTWNERILREYGVASVRTVIQGIDPTLFHPAPKAGLMPGRFLVFSGGKLELRKGQDLVLAAFRRFAERHSDAVLVTAWHSPWPQFARTVDVSGQAAPVVFGPNGKVDATAWAAANGIPADQFVDLGAVPNALIAPILREMDVALFPNRSEGGTNLVAMECMACGVPTILSANTGHLDLIQPDSCYPLAHQRPVSGPYAGVGTTPGWGESSVDEIVDRLEKAYSDQEDARRKGAGGAALMAARPWARTAAEMRDVVLSLI